MEMEEFKIRLMEELKKHLADELAECNLKIINYNKVNRKVTGLMVEIPGENVVPVYDVNELYQECLEYGSFENYITEFAKTVSENTTAHKIKINESSLSDAEILKSHIICQLINSKYNLEILKDIPHTNFMDLSMIYRVDLSHIIDDGQTATFVINNSMMEKLEMTKAELHETALKNSAEMFPVTIRPMGDVIKELMDDIYKKDDVTDFSDLKMFVVTNPKCTNGAAAMIYGKEQIHELAGQLDSNFFILPSSVHEVLLIPDNKDSDLQGLKDMVYEVNRTQVAMADRLSDNVYYYDRNKRCLEMAVEESYNKNRELSARRKNGGRLK